MSTKTEFSYEKAVSRLETIVREIENNSQDIDSLVDKLKEAQGLIKQCKEKLYKVENELKAITKDD